MRSFWSRVPMLRILFAMIVGIGLEIATETWFHHSAKAMGVATFAVLASVIFVLITATLKNITLVYRLRLYNGFALNASIVAFAWLLTWFSFDKCYNSHFSNFLTEQNVLLVQINEPPVLRDKAVRVNAEVKEVSNVQGHYSTTGKIQLNFLRDTFCERLNYGDVLLVKSKIDTMTGPKNPDEFNFKTYYGFHHIYNRAFVVHSDWKLIDTAKGNKALAAVYALRSSFLKIIAHYVTDKNDFGVASAIMLGYKDYVSFDIYQAYENSGVVQILSISAFHVGIMFFMLNFLLQWMDKRGRKMAFLKTAIIITFIWFYTCLTGLSLPVLRCALMFTLIQLGILLIRNVNNYNIVAASAVLLLLINPLVITEIGFQLSYLAVFGLYFIQPKIARLLIIKAPDGPHYRKQSNWLLKPVTFLMHDLLWFVFKSLDFIWQLMAASIAAQIAILPLCLFYFYQFPNLFLLSNTIVIPLSNLLIFAGTVLFAVGHIPFINDIAGWVFSHLLWLLNKFIFWMDTVPFSVSKGISISAAEMILVYLVIFLLCWLSEERKNKVLISALGVVLLLCSFRSYKNVERAEQKQIVVYAVSKQKAVAFISGNNLYCDFDSTLMNDESNMQLHIHHHWWECGIKSGLPIKDKELTSAPGIYSTRIAQGRIVLFEGKKILIVDSLSSTDVAGMQVKFKPDLVIISGTLKISIPMLKKSVDFDEVVFDSKCRPASRKRWKIDCAKLNIDYWDVNAQGAYVCDLRNDQR